MNLDRLTQRAKSALLHASKGSSRTTALLLLQGIESSGGVGALLLQSFPELSLDSEKKLSISILIKKSYYYALKLGQPYVGTEHLLLALLHLLGHSKIDAVKTKLLSLSVFPQVSVDLSGATKNSPVLNTFSENLNYKVLVDSDRSVISREEFDTVVSILLQQKKANVLIVGEPGVGKRSLIELLVRSINDMQVPPALIGHTVLEFDLPAFVTSTFQKGGAEQGVSMLFEELKERKRTILAIKDFQSLFFPTTAGFAVPLVYSTFKSNLSMLGLRYIATLSESLYTRLMADNDHILDAFSVINLSAPNAATTLDILRSTAVSLSNHHNVTISDALVNYVYKKAREDIKGLKFPQKGIDLLDQACTKFVMDTRKVPNSYKTMVEKSILLTEGLDRSLDVSNYTAALRMRDELERLENEMWTVEQHMFRGRKRKLLRKHVDSALYTYQLATNMLPNTQLVSLSTVAARIKNQIIGQDIAVDTVSKSLIRARLGLRSKQRPLGNFLFLGPTGVGKTELAKVLAVEAFGTDNLIRLDMSDFAEKHNVARLVGAPPGYVGYGDGGDLTSKIELTPDSVVLFDEIEKAHPDVLNILLQIMEEGELMDARGTTYDFSRAVVILTSNLGTNIIHNKDIGFGNYTLSDASLEDRLRSNLKKILKPELLNRLDEVIVFKRLTKEEQSSILDLLLAEVKETLRDQQVHLRVGAKAKDYLLAIGYSDEYGARSLRRIVEKELLDKIAEILLDTTMRPLRLSVGIASSGLVIKTL